MTRLQDFGWNSHWENIWQELTAGDTGTLPARVTAEQKSLFRVRCADGELWAEPAGKLLHRAEERDDLPVVGDWVGLRRFAGSDRGTIVAILSRRTKLSRQLAGRRVGEQVIAANLDTIFHVTALDRDFSPRRIERYVAMIFSSGARPVVLLNKCDLHPEDQVSAFLAQAQAAALGVDVHATSAVTNAGTDGLVRYLRPGETIALLGSSGVGKSTLVNCLLGREVQAVQPTVERTSRGRHTTTARQMILLPHGGILIDTPGMRELAPWDAEDGLGQTFADVEALFAACRFTDCGHQGEPGCAVGEALALGALDVERWRSYRKLQRELRFQTIKHDAAARAAQTRRWRSIHKAQRDFYRFSGKS